MSRKVVIDVLYHSGHNANVWFERITRVLLTTDHQQAVRWANRYWPVTPNTDESNQRLGIYGRITVPQHMVQRRRGWQ